MFILNYDIALQLRRFLSNDVSSYGYRKRFEKCNAKERNEGIFSLIIILTVKENRLIYLQKYVINAISICIVECSNARRIKTW